MTPSGLIVLILASWVLHAQPPACFPSVPLAARRARTARLCLVITAAAAGAAVLAMARRRRGASEKTRTVTATARALPWSGRLWKVLTRVDVWILIATIAGVVIAYLTLARSR